MTWPHAERLYNWLPAIYRVRDAAQGEALRALLAVIETELETLETDLEGLYDNWFIETCAEWVTLYIGDQLGVRHLHSVDSAGLTSLRAYVANTLRYRQRKGTAAVLEQLGRDVANWPARVVEYFQLLGTTQHLNHVRLHNHRTPDLRQGNLLELLNTPFDVIAHSGEVRRISRARGRYNIPWLGLHVWRLPAYFLARATPRAVVEPADGRYRFHPLGLDGALWNRPETETSITHVATERNVPAPLRRRAVIANKNAYLDPDHDPSLELYLDGARLTPEQIHICYLGNWDEPGWSPPAGDGTPWVVVDPEWGRLALLPAAPAFTTLEVSFTYGFSSDLGGGPYRQSDALAQSQTRPVTWQVTVDDSAAAVPDVTYPTLTEAISAWQLQPAGSVGVITFANSHTYREDLTGANVIPIPEGSQLSLIADGLRPHVRGDISVRGEAPADSPNPGALVLHGLLLEGELRVLVGNLGGLSLYHCTLPTGREALFVNPSVDPDLQNSRLHVVLDHTISGGVNLAATVPRLTVLDSIVDHAAGVDLLAAGADVVVEDSTIIGADDADSPPALRTLYASNSIFSGRLVVERRQTGCLRFSYAPSPSRTPRRYRCQPDLALEGVTDPAEQEAVRVQLTPLFTASDYGHPAYRQLAAAAAPGLRSGAEDGSEMGAFSHLKQPQREANLRLAVEEYLPFGLEAGLFFVT